jgi:hypothetical protein
MQSQLQLQIRLRILAVTALAFLGRAGLGNPAGRLRMNGSAA